MADVHPGETFLLRLTAKEPNAAILRTVRSICGGGLGGIKSALTGAGLEWRVRLHHNDHDELAAGIRELARTDGLGIEVEDVGADPAETEPLEYLLSCLDSWDELVEQQQRLDDLRYGEDS